MEIWAFANIVAKNNKLKKISFIKLKSLTCPYIWTVDA